MKQYILLLLLWVLGQGLFAQNRIDYDPDDQVIANPERGFYHHTETNPSNYSSLSESVLRNYRGDGFTLILRVFYMSSFVESDISADYLEKMQEDFDVLRNAGMKVIVRFAYTKKSSSPYGDAPLDVVLRHLEQLRPVLQKNGDVIAVVQAGFIGAWGEWYYTDHFSQVLGSPSETDWENRRALVQGLLEAIPANRFIQVRTPDIKMQLTERLSPVTPDEMDEGSESARIGHHNDCFLASPNDVGTYRDSAFEKPFLEAETALLPMGGETCGVYVPLSECQNTLREMRRFHWSYINVDYHPDVIQGWRTNDCFTEIEKSLGYRYRLLSAEAEDQLRPGAAFSLDLTLVNDGFANVYNHRDMELVLRNGSSGEEYYLPVMEDPRFWSLNEQVNLQVTGGLPENIEAGDYELFLNMPDSEVSLRTNPDYSIRLANLNTWEAVSGYNRLMMTIHIDPANSAATAYQGAELFRLKRQGPAGQAMITVDGDPADWAQVDMDYQDPGQSLESSGITVAPDSLYLLIRGTDLLPGHQVFINADGQNSGYQAWQWTENGADYLIEDETLYKYNGTGVDWNWTLLGSIHKAQSDTAMEWAIGLDDLPMPSPGQTFSYAHINDPSATVATHYLPPQTESFIRATGNLYLDGPTMGNAYGGSTMLYWAEGSGYFRGIERKGPGESTFHYLGTVAAEYNYFVDEHLESGSAYTYRHYLTNGTTFSAYSTPITRSPDGRDIPYIDIIIDGETADWDPLPPVSVVRGEAVTQLKGHRSAEYYYFMMQGDVSADYRLLLDADADPLSGAMPGYWTREGFDVMIYHDSIFQYQGDQWIPVDGKVESASGTDALEIRIPLESGGIGQDLISMYCGLVSDPDAGTLLPLAGTPARTFQLYPAATTPAGFALKASGTYPDTRIVVEWDTDPLNDSYILERGLAETGPFDTVALLSGTDWIYRDDGLQPGTRYYYRMRSFNMTGPSAYTEILSLPTSKWGLGIDTDRSSGRLSIFPIPMQESVHLEYTLDADARVTISLYDASGRLEQRIANGNQQAGYHRYLIKREGLPAGLYFLHFADGKTSESKKLILK